MFGMAERLRGTLIACAALVCAALIGCQLAHEPGTGGTPGVLRIAGDTPLGDLPQSLLNAFEAQSRGTLVTYQQLDRAQVLAAIQAGQIDGAFMLYPPDDRSVFQTAVGYQALAAAASPDLGITNLSQDDLRAIFAGKKSNWNEVGGPDLPIVTVVPFDRTSDRMAFEAIIMQHEPVSLSTVIAGNQAQRAAILMGGKGRVGILPGSAMPDGLQALTIDGVAMPSTNHEPSAYPLTVEIGFVAAAEPQGDAKQLLDWVLSPDGQELVADYALPLN